jgi:hypothetical protein
MKTKLEQEETLNEIRTKLCTSCRHEIDDVICFAREKFEEMEGRGTKGDSNETT